MLKSIINTLSLIDPAHRKWTVPLVGTTFASVLLEFGGGVAVYHLISMLAGNEAITTARMPTWLMDTGGNKKVVISWVLGIFVTKNLVRLGDLYFRGVFVEMVLTANSQRLLQHYLRAPFEFHQGQHSSGLVRSLVKDADEISREVLHALLGAFAEIAVVLALGILLFVTAPGVTLIVALVMVVVAALIVAKGKGGEIRWGKRYQKISDQIFRHLQETLSSVTEIRVAQAEPYVEREYMEAREALSNLVRHRTILQTWPGVALEMLLIGGLLALIGWVLNTGKADTVFPVIGIFAYAGLRMLPAMGRMLASFATIRSSSEIIRPMIEELPKAGSKFDSAGHDDAETSPITFEGEIVFENVTYVYEGREHAGVYDLSERIGKGESLAITGESGAGKTTFLLLLMGLLKPQKGRILVDGEDIHADVRGWHRLIGYVSQNSPLFATSIAENIAFAQDPRVIDREQVRHVSELAELTEWLKTLPTGADTEVGEAAGRISGGQRQRIAIARALYRNPSVMVLDEPTSGLDVETEAAVRSGLLSAAARMTLVMVTHRPETAAACDREVRLLAGRVVERR